MNVSIPKDTHRPSLWSRVILFIYSLFSTELTVSFPSSSRYKLSNDADQFDINKLFGFWQGNIHLWSVRWGWNYDPEIDMINLYEYRYQQGLRRFEKRATINVGSKITLGINKKTNKVYIRDKYGKVIDLQNIVGYDTYPKRTLRIHTGVYFGGNNPAPKTLKLKLHLMKRFITKVSKINRKLRLLLCFLSGILMGLIVPLAIATLLTEWGSLATEITGIAGFFMLFVLTAIFFTITTPELAPNKNTTTTVEEYMITNTTLQPSQQSSNDEM